MVVSSSDKEQGNEQPPTDNTDDEEEEEVVEPEGRERRLVSHHDRWRSFLLDVWDEEARLRIPISLTVIPKDCANEEISGDGASTTIVLL